MMVERPLEIKGGTPGISVTGRPGAAETDDTKDTRILLVDDEKMILKTFSLMLGDYGYYLQTASTAEEALELVRKEQFDIVFLDQHIGKDRGIELMQKMTGVNRSLYYIIITANGHTDLAVEALKRGASDFLTKPLFMADIMRSIQFVLRKRDLDEQREAFLHSLETKVRERTQELEAMHLEVLASLAQALEARDFGTSGHCKRVSRLAVMIAEALGLTEEEKRQVEIGALLHDVGKIGINDFILMKPGKLEGDEWTSLKSHPAKGVEILRPLKYLEPALPGILHHHEHYDGSGYPHGLKEEQIPLMARIIAVADAWDVMRSDRSYRKALSAEEAMRELVTFSGRQFDPSIVKVLVGILHDAATRTNDASC